MSAAFTVKAVTAGLETVHSGFAVIGRMLADATALAGVGLPMLFRAVMAC
jgi:hypothetical protein